MSKHQRKIEKPADPSEPLKPVSLYGVDPDDALRAALQVKPEDLEAMEKAEKKAAKKSKKKG